MIDFLFGIVHEYDFVCCIFNRVGFERLMALGSACVCLSEHVDQNLLKQPASIHGPSSGFKREISSPAGLAVNMI